MAKTRKKKADKTTTKKKESERLDPIISVCLILLVAFARMPNGNLFKLLLCLPIVAYIWYDPRERPLSLLAKIITTVSILLLSFAHVSLSNRWAVLFDMISVVLLASYLIGCIVLKLEDTRNNFYLWLFVCVIPISLLVRASYYSFTEGFPFIVISLLFGVLVSVVIIAIRYWKISTILESICTFLIICFIASALCWAFLVHINGVFDFEEPQIRTAIVEKKDIDSPRKGPDPYELYCDLNGELIRLEVPAYKYYAYEVGDAFPIDLYEGALGVPFYISGNYWE